MNHAEFFLYIWKNLSVTGLADKRNIKGVTSDIQ